ncbi:MAG: hypothetical protein A2Y07_11845 [Planctomycetes bacterium GWF2_50_10]|nr:MAG: hypothetical protein A2Y07_11845 [Planctomycetes bacterium GWF2_50_10]
MRSNAKTGGLETLISVLLLCAVALVLAGVYFKQFNYDKLHFQAEAANAHSGDNEAQVGLEKIAPAGFTAGVAQIFDNETLYEKIDGKADLYLESGFQKMTCQMFVKAGKEDTWFEFYAYDMGTGLNAFAVYGVQRRPEGQVLDVSELAYRTADAVFFCKGKYYCEVMSSGLDEQLAAAMVEAARKFVKNFASQAGGIPQIEMFPKQQLVAGSYKYFISGAYGFDRFKNTFSARYDVDGVGVTAFIVDAGDGTEAQKLAAEYKQFVIENAQGQEVESNNEQLKGAVLDLGGFYEIVFAKGKYVAGVHEAEDKAAGEKIAEELLKKIQIANSK